MNITLKEETLGQRIRAQRIRMGMTQEELADKLYVSRQTISSWENDKSYPDIHSLLMILTVIIMVMNC